jgi:hypothetical protein
MIFFHDRIEKLRLVQLRVSPTRDTYRAGDRVFDKEIKMGTKIFVAAGLLAAMIASPAWAQTSSQRTEASASDQGSRPSGRSQSTSSRYDVYLGGLYVGADPDPNIRVQLPREHGGTEW